MAPGVRLRPAKWEEFGRDYRIGRNRNIGEETFDERSVGGRTIQIRWHRRGDGSLCRANCRFDVELEVQNVDRTVLKRVVIEKKIAWRPLLSRLRNRLSAGVMRT